MSFKLEKRSHFLENATSRLTHSCFGNHLSFDEKNTGNKGKEDKMINCMKQLKREMDWHMALIFINYPKVASHDFPF